MICTCPMLRWVCFLSRLCLDIKLSPSHFWGHFLSQDFCPRTLFTQSQTKASSIQSLFLVSIILWRVFAFSFSFFFCLLHIGRLTLHISGVLLMHTFLVSYSNFFFFISSLCMVESDKHFFGIQGPVLLGFTFWVFIRLTAIMKLWLCCLCLCKGSGAFLCLFLLLHS